MMFLSILEFSTSSTRGYMRSPMSSTTATEAASKARPPAGGKASDIPTMVKTAESSRTGARLAVWCCGSMESRTPRRAATMGSPGVVEIPTSVIEIVAVDDRSAVGDVGVMIVNHCSAMPVVSPVMPAPPISSEEADPEADSKSNPRSRQEDPRHGIPAWICDDRLAVHEPGIIGRHVDHLRIDWFDDDCVALSCYFLLFIANQVVGLVSLLTHRLDGIRHFLLLIGVCVSKG